MIRPYLAHATIALLVLSTSCAEQRPAIDRTQPDALDKSFFVGELLNDTSDDPEFWFQGTLVDVGYGASQSGLFTSTYAQPVSRIKWIIQEDLLIARLTYERIAESDGKGAGPASNDGIVVAAFKIDKHFDIRRGYNPITGEETNILEENTTDRPWHQRQYMRVDWSENNATDTYDYDTLSQLGVFGGVEYESLKYYVNDPADDDAPRFEDGYFDITTKAFAKPKMVDLSHLGWSIDKFPACFLPSEFSGGTEPAGSCNPVELTIRLSFRQVEDSDYEPREWDGFRFQSFGAFTTERKGYNRSYGMSDDQWRRFISRYNIWERSHHYADAAAMTGAVECFTPETTPFGANPHRDENNDGTEDECAAVGAGSQCDEFRQRCTLPYALRKTRPVIWYFTQGSNAEYFEPTKDATQQWDVAMRTAVQTARYTECMRVEGDRAACVQRFPMYFEQQNENEDALNLATEVDNCRAGIAYAGKDCNALADEIGNARGYSAGVIAIAKADEMVILCHSPVVDTDPAACGARDLVVRMGDLRFHQVNVIPIPQTPSPWGIYTDSHDPLTGETIAASINVWSHVNDLWSQSIVDKVRYIGGELSTEEVTDGTYVQNWVAASRASSGSGLLPRISKAELDHRIADFANVSVERMQELRTLGKTDLPLLKQLDTMSRELETIRFDALAPSTTRAIHDARRELATGSTFEAGLNTRMMQELSGLDKVPSVGSSIALTSPLRGNHPAIVRDLEMRKELNFADHGSCVRNEAPSPTSLTGLSDLLQLKFGAFDPNSAAGEQLARAEKIRHYLAQRAHFSVILHEMGHSIGMRHNFVSSSDAWGYRPQYWQLRTKNGADLPECTDVVADGNSCVGPRWFDPMTDEERNQLIWMFMQSSTMDYAGEQTQDLLGLGAYDFAAARMFYGDVASVFADPSYNLGTDRGTAMLSKQDNFGGTIGYRWTRNGSLQNGEIHYSQLNDAFDLIRNCTAVDPNMYKPANWNVDEKGEWHPVLDGGLVSVDGVYSRCRTQPVDYVNWNTMRSATDEETGGFSRGGNAVDATDRVRVPYGFATDRWADLGNIAVYRHDNGADPYELFNFFITEQEVNHIFDNYRRGRQSFSVRSAAMRTLNRYNTKMRDGAKGLGLLANIYRDFSLDVGYDYNTLWPFIVGNGSGYNALATNVLASGLAFDHFTRMMARPEPGEHYVDRNANVLRSVQDAPGVGGETALIIPNGPTGLWDEVGIGGKPIENALADNKGEYDSEFTINAGSYYDKVFSTMLLTESEDNFISDSRRDFTDPRYRAVSMADLFPEGYRRWLANNLTDDDEIKGAWVATNNGDPMADPETHFPLQPMGWTSWWTQRPEVCFPSGGSTVCSALGASGGVGGSTDEPVMSVDPQVGWEQQKFLIAWTLMYLPENQQRHWIDMMGVWSLGEDSDPSFTNRIELHDPSGRVYIAKTFGKETIFGKSVQKGVAARVLEYGNELLAAAYETDPGPDLNGDGEPDWNVPRLGADGELTVLYDPSIALITPGGGVNGRGRLGCDARSSIDCKCEENRACVMLSRYVSVPSFMRQAQAAFGLADPSMKGLY